MTNSREAKTIPADSKWAAGYAAGKASLQAELDWHREEVARLTAGAMPSGEWQLVPKEPTEAMLDAAWAITQRASADDRMAAALATPEQSHRFKTRRRWKAMLSAAPSAQEKADIADHGDKK